MLTGLLDKLFRQKIMIWQLLLLGALHSFRSASADVQECVYHKDDTDYRGKQAITSSGLECISWSDARVAEMPVNPATYPDQGLQGPYCRNPKTKDGLFKGKPLKSKLWCYAAINSVLHVQYCDIPLCPAQGKGCLTEEKGVRYRGSHGKTVSGNECLDWSFAKLKSEWSVTSLVGKTCRNPDDDTSLWCFVTAQEPANLDARIEETKKEKCHLETCKEIAFKECVDNWDPKGTMYRGTISKTENGVECIPWETEGLKKLKSPMIPDIYPHQGLDGKGNRYCRNPAGSSKRPWCYVGTGKYDWDWCHVERCPGSLGGNETAEDCVLHSDKKGVYYRGVQNWTTTGKDCLRWDDYRLNKRNYNTIKFPRLSDGLINNNYCRNPRGQGEYLWCYYLEKRSDGEQVNWYYCDVPYCTVDECLSTEDRRGLLYVGNEYKTSQGYRCAYWNDKRISPEKFNYQTMGRINGLGKHNFCRNPGNFDKPWCYYISGSGKIKWGYCDIEICSKLKKYPLKECLNAPRGRSYRGSYRVGRSGHTCLDWNDKLLHHKSFVNPTNTPELEGAGATCRNPRGLREGPWCYVIATDDPEHPGEIVEDFCDIPYCPPDRYCSDQETADCSVYHETLEEVHKLTFTAVNNHKCYQRGICNRRSRDFPPCCRTATYVCKLLMEHCKIEAARFIRAEAMKPPRSGRTQMQMPRYLLNK